MYFRKILSLVLPHPYLYSDEYNLEETGVLITQCNPDSFVGMVRHVSCPGAENKNLLSFIVQFATKHSKTKFKEGNITSLSYNIYFKKETCAFIT